MIAALGRVISSESSSVRRRVLTLVGRRAVLALDRIRDFSRNSLIAQCSSVEPVFACARQV